MARPSSDGPAHVPWTRYLNIGLRTVHIGVSGTLVGGHVFAVAPVKLYPWLWAVILSGGALLAVEAWGAARWFHQGRGVAVLGKLALLALIPWCWNQRVIVLSIVIVLASVGSHMPGRFRYYSLLHRRILD